MEAASELDLARTCFRALGLPFRSHDARHVAPYGYGLTAGDPGLLGRRRDARPYRPPCVISRDGPHFGLSDADMEGDRGAGGVTLSQFGLNAGRISR